MIRACIDMNAYDRLDAVTCPTLVIGSYADKTLFPQGSIELAEKLGCELYMYSGYSHAVYDEAPDYREHLLDFFNK